MNQITSQNGEASILELTLNNGEKLLQFKQNGDILLRGKLIENDIEVVECFREFLAQTNIIK